MRVKIKRVDKTLPLPRYETAGACCFDLIVREDVTVPPKEIALLPANCIIEVPEGYALVLAPRSSMPKKTGLLFPHSIGIIDQDFCGPEDEIKIQVYNFTNGKVQVKRGDRIAQGKFVKIERPEWEEIEFVDKPTRGGFGGTGEKVKEEKNGE